MHQYKVTLKTGAKLDGAESVHYSINTGNKQVHHKSHLVARTIYVVFKAENTMAIKCVVILCCVVSTVLCAPSDQKYTDKYDHINVKEILENDKLLMAYFECMMGRGKCTPEGKELKENLVEAIETGCEKCTKAQQDGTYIVIEHLINHKKEMWDELCAKFDPTGKWRKTYEERAKEKGLTIPDI